MTSEMENATLRDPMIADPLTLEEVAHRLQTSLSTVERLIRTENGKLAPLESIKLLPGRRSCRRVTQAQLQKFLVKREAESLPRMRRP